MSLTKNHLKYLYRNTLKMLCLGVFDPPRLAPYHLKCPRIQSASPTLSPVLIAHKIPIPGYLHISSWCDCPCDYIPYGRVLHTPAILMIGIANPLPKKSGPIWRCLSKNCKHAITAASQGHIQKAFSALQKSDDDANEMYKWSFSKWPRWLLPKVT